MPTFWSFAAVLPLVGLTSITMMNNANAYVQTTTDPALRGRVMSLYMAIVMGGTPIGAPIIGAIANAFGPRWGLVAGATGGLIPAVIAVIWWMRRRRVRLGWEPARRWPFVVRGINPGMAGGYDACRPVLVLPFDERSHVVEGIGDEDRYGIRVAGEGAPLKSCGTVGWLP